MPIMVDEMVKVEFLVKYKKNPHYTGAFNADLKPGLHGTFDNLADAEKQRDRCRRWLNEEHSLTSRENDSGVIVDMPTVKTHDVAVVWIEEYHDGVLQKSKKEAAA